MKIIEFTGTAKSGKSKLIEKLANAISGDKKVSISEVGFRNCPFKDEKSLDFQQQIWTTFAVINKILEEKNKIDKPDILILDRGLWDRKIWVEFLYSCHIISKSEQSYLNLILNKFVDQVDQVFYIITPHEISNSRNLAKNTIPRLNKIETEQLNIVMKQVMPSYAVGLDGSEKIDVLFDVVKSKLRI